MQSRHREETEHASYEPIEPPVSISYFFHVLSAYRGVIFLSLAAVAIGFSVFALGWFLRAPSQQITSVPFRLEFKGAAEGKYPNGTKFSTNDILSMPILLHIYEQNGLRQYVNFPTFARAIFIVENNKEYERLQAEYSARLADIKLTPVDRERIEREFDSKREALNKGDYAMKYLVANRRVAIPEIVLRKVLRDILRDWATYATKTQRGLLYDVPVLSPRFVDLPAVEPANHLAALQLLRAKVTQIRHNLNQIAQLPGVQLVRTRDDSSLEEIKLQLEDLLRFRIEPQLTVLRASGLITNQALAIQFLESQLAHDERRLQAAERKADAIREALNTYTRTGAPQFESAPVDSASGSRGTGDVVMPQISDTFLDRLVQMSNLGADQRYRQSLTDDLRSASTEMIPIREAVEFDRQLLDAVRKGTPRTTTATSEEITVGINLAKNELRQLIVEMNEVYVTASRNLSPATALYTLEGPTTTEVARTVTVRRLAAYGLFVLMASIPLIAIGCLIHNRVRQEEAEMSHAGKEYPSTSEAAI